jgi:hypothetical protein
MSKEIKCFFVVESGRTRRSLRRYQGSDQAKCEASGYGYHNASAPIEDGEQTPGSHVSSPPVNDYAGDPRWPTHCACGYEFQPADQHQVFAESIYRNEATGEEWPMRELPPGAVYDAWWYRDEEDKPRRGTGMGTGTGADGLCLCVCLPPDGGLDYWYVDGGANNGPGWERTGTVPNITANPSILTPRYHGWLRAGVLISC